MADASVRLIDAIFGKRLDAETKLVDGIEDVLKQAINNLQSSCYKLKNSSELDNRLHKILLWRFGFESPHPSFVPTRQNIGSILGITRERVRQIEAKALRKLRHPSRSRLFREYIKIKRSKE